MNLVVIVDAGLSQRILPKVSGNASTITTKFTSISNGRFGHPDEDRALSIREGATLQTFPKSYVFKSSNIATTARLIGNAVPCEYARRLGEMIVRGI